MIDLVEVTYPRPRTCVIALHGEHDRVTAERIERLFREALAGNDLVVVESAMPTFIDSSFVRNLLSLTDKQRNSRRCSACRSVPPRSSDGCSR